MNISRTSTSSARSFWTYALSFVVHFLSRLTPSSQKNKQIRTVVNKLDSIDTKFRFFKMELIAGEPDFVVQHVSFPRGLGPSLVPFLT
jgi:hypothetical protein